MKYKDEDPDNLGELGDMLPAEVLKELNRLLERLHQWEDETMKEFKNERKIEIVIVQSGGQHVDNVENQNFYGDKWAKTKKSQEETELCTLPPQLRTEAALILWKKAQTAGYVDENYQPLMSRTQAALLADAMAERLGIREKWKVFETLWNRKNMYRDYYQALGQQKTLIFQDELKKVLA